MLSASDVVGGVCIVRVAAGATANDITTTPVRAGDATLISTATVHSVAPGLPCKRVIGARQGRPCLSREELEACRQAADPRTRQCLDWLYFTGARVSEFLRLTPEHVRDGLVLLPERKKRMRERPVPMHPSLDPSVLPWPVKRDQVTRDLRNLGRSVGIRLHAHLPRSTMATHLLEAGVDIRTVGELLGHNSLDSTLRYLAVSDERKRRAIGPWS